MNRIIFSRGSKKGSLYGPASEKPLLNPAVIQAQFVYPVNQNLGTVVIGHHYITAAISSLRLVGYPFAVARFVVAVVVDSLNRSALRIRTFAHVGQEIQKSALTKPSLANCNPPTAVIRVIRISGIQDTGFQMLPRLIFRFPRNPIRAVSLKTFFVSFGAADFAVRGVARFLVRGSEEVRNEFGRTTLAAKLSGYTNVTWHVLAPKVRECVARLIQRFASLSGPSLILPQNL